MPRIRETGGWEHVQGKQVGGRRWDSTWAKASSHGVYAPFSHPTLLTKHKDNNIMSFKTNSAALEWGPLCSCTGYMPMKLVLFLFLQKWLWEGTMLGTPEASLKGIREGIGAICGHGVTLLVKNFRRRRSRENLPSILPFFCSFTSTRATKEDLLPSVGLVSIALNNYNYSIIISISLVIIRDILIALFSKERQAHYPLILATSLCHKHWRDMIISNSP